jgi:hypothetical protein
VIEKKSGEMVATTKYGESPQDAIDRRIQPLRDRVGGCYGISGVSCEIIKVEGIDGKKGKQKVTFSYQIN